MGILAHVFKTQHTYLQTMFAATQQIASVAGLKATKVQSKSVSKVVKADIYPEFGTYPGGGESPLASEGSGYPSFWNVLIIETILVGGAEAYRTGMVDPVFDELSVGDVSPGGRFDPLSLAESGDLEELKIKELKHCRLSMFAWLGCIMQALATQEGPIANWTAHTADPVHANVLTNAAKGFGFY